MDASDRTVNRLPITEASMAIKCRPERTDKHAPKAVRVKSHGGRLSDLYGNRVTADWRTARRGGDFAPRHSRGILELVDLPLDFCFGTSLSRSPGAVCG